MSAYDRLIEQIDSFIKKFYKKELLKGLIWLLGVFVISLLVVSGLEYIGRFNSYVRAVLLFGFIVANGFILGKFVVFPLLRLLKYGKRISHTQAAGIIGAFFPDISDRLLNTLQLNDSGNNANYELIRASVVQKSKALSGFRFTDAVDLRDNWKYVKYLSPVFGLLLMVAVYVPDWLTEGTKRVVNFQEEYIPEAPFKFILPSKKMKVEEGEDVKLKISFQGDVLPRKAYFISEKGKFLMNELNGNSFDAWIENVQSSSVIYFEAMGYKSQEIELEVLSKSSASWASARLDFPKYLKLENEVVSNVGDLIVPEGTGVKGFLKMKNVLKPRLNLMGKSLEFSGSQIEFNEVFRKDEVLVLNYQNTKFEKDSTLFKVKVIKDEFPQISVSERRDTSIVGRVYFTGQAQDDHGLTKLYFSYEVLDENGVIVKVRKEDLSLSDGRSDNFDYVIDFTNLDLKSGQRLNYWFAVSDNDGVNGSKWTKTPVNVYEVPSLKEIGEKRKDEQANINDKLQESIQRSIQMKKDVERLKKEAAGNSKNDYKMRKEMERLQNEQKDLLNKLRKLDEDISKSRNNKESLSPMDEEMKQMEEAIQDLLKEVLDEELMDLLKELEDLLKKQDVNKFQEELEKLDRGADEQKNQMERSLEMLKRLQVNERIDELEERLKALAEDQKELKKDVENKALSTEEKKELQENLNKEFDEIKKDLEHMHELNDALKKPLDLDKQEEKKESISNEMNEAGEKLGKGQDKKAGGNQQNAAEQMEEMAEELNSMQEDSNQEQAGEDLEALKQILQNLMTLSFDQESNMKGFSKVADNDPAYQRYAAKQRKVIDNSKAVADSLKSLADRQPKIASFIDKELGDIAANHDLIVESIDEHKRRELGAQQQFVMTSYNNLALLLNESLEQMQNQMKNQKPGQGSCNKPGGKGRPKPGSGMGTQDMKQMLKQQLEQMKEGIGKGPKPGENGKPGNQGKPGEGMGGFGPKQVAKMAAEQQAIRQRLEQLRDELNKDGSGAGNKLNDLIDELEKQEDDLVNRRINRELIDRQQEIMTRLLESEKALNERGMDEKRESESGKNYENGNLIRFDEYNKEKRRQIELIRSVNPGLNKYYKDKTNDYYNKTL